MNDALAVPVHYGLVHGRWVRIRICTVSACRHWKHGWKLQGRDEHVNAEDTRSLFTKTQLDAFVKENDVQS